MQMKQKQQQLTQTLSFDSRLKVLAQIQAKCLPKVGDPKKGVLHVEKICTLQMLVPHTTQHQYPAA